MGGLVSERRPGATCEAAGFVDGHLGQLRYVGTIAARMALLLASHAQERPGNHSYEVSFPRLAAVRLRVVHGALLGAPGED